MDSQKLGSFIAEMRKKKGMTQRDLADKLNVTDKAVSKWERGLGLPDIRMIEPLAEALGVSILDIMRSECTQQEALPPEQVSQVLSDVIDTATYHRRIERRNTVIGCLGVIAAVTTVFLIDIHGIFGFAMTFLPIIMLPISIILLVNSWRKWRRNLPYAAPLILGILALLIPVMLFLLLILAPILEGPVPN